MIQETCLECILNVLCADLSAQHKPWSLSVYQFSSWKVLGYKNYSYLIFMNFSNMLWPWSYVMVKHSMNIKICYKIYKLIGRRGEDQYIWTAWFAWPLILVRMWNVLFADQFAMIPNIDIHDTLDAVHAGSTLPRSFGLLHTLCRFTTFTTHTLGCVWREVSFTRRILNLPLTSGER